jgi:hypothetical protein
MPRQNKRSPAGPERPLRGGIERYEEFQGERHAVRSVSGSAAGKDYRCPGCDQVVRAGQPHVVTWAADDLGASNRRHWHTPCWAARDRRGPTR